MKPILRTLSRAWPLLVWSAVGLILFVPVLGYYQALPSPDAPPFFPAGYRLQAIEQILAGAVAVSPHDLILLLLPPLVNNDLIYLIDTLLIAAGCAYLLRGRGIPPVAAWIGGGILAFSGYSFTLISAGHMGYFHMTVYVMFMLGFLARAVDRGRWFHYALAGIFGAWILKFGPDLGLLYLMLAMLYGLWLVLRNTAGTPGSVRLRRLGVGVPVAALCFLLGASSSIRTILTVHLKNRQAQIAGTVAQPKPPGAAPAEAAPADPQAQWIFATNWSLPPTEIVEFVAPCLFGTQSGDPRAPYWGKLGRTLGWEQHRQGFPNFRQHAIYLGGLQLMLAAFAVGGWLRWRRRVQGSGFREAAGFVDKAHDKAHDKARDKDSQTRVQKADLRVERSQNPIQDQSAPWLADVPFWAGVWVIGLLLALGRHAPLYRLFYSLPYMSLLRAPVKFVRFVELATALLAASGLACLLQPPVRRLRGWMIGAGVCAGLGLLGAIWTSGADATLRHTLEPMGLAPATALLRSNLIHALLHGTVAFAVAGSLFFLRVRLRNGVRSLLVVAAVWLAVDALLVNRRFIMAYDVTPYYQLNRVSRAVLTERTPGLTIADYMAVGQERDWYNKSLWTRQINNCVRSRLYPEEPCVKLMLALERDPIRFWRLAGASYSVLPLSFAKSLPREAGTVVDIFTLLPGRLADVHSEKDAVALVKLKEAPPYAWLSPAWVAVPDDQNFDALLRQSNPFAIAVVSGAAAESAEHRQPPGSVTVQSERFHQGAMKTVLNVNSPGAQMLTVRTPFEPGLAASVDGVGVPLLRSNHLFCGVAVPSGSHTVTIALARNPMQAVLGAAPLVVVLAVLAAVRFSRSISMPG